MSTAKPRITITLEPHAHEVLRRLSAAGGDSMSSLVTSFLDVAIPPMERLVVVLEQAKLLPDETKQNIAEALLRAEADLLPALTALSDQNDLFLVDVLKRAKGPASGKSTKETAAPARKRRLPPVAVTRGVGQPKRTKKGGRRGLV